MGFKKKKFQKFRSQKRNYKSRRSNQSINKKKIKFLTLYTFSSDNWKRPKIEINFLLNLLENYIDKEFNNLKNKNIKIKVLGDISKFSTGLKTKLRKVERKTNNNNLIQVNIALNYGSRQELINAFKKINYNKKKKNN